MLVAPPPSPGRTPPAGREAGTRLIIGRSLELGRNRYRCKVRKRYTEIQRLAALRTVQNARRERERNIFFKL